MWTDPLTGADRSVWVPSLGALRNRTCASFVIVPHLGAPCAVGVGWALHSVGAMVLITDRAALELQRILRSNMARPRQGVRLQVNEIDQLSMSIDVAHLGDSVFRRDHEPLRGDHDPDGRQSRI